MSEDTRPPSGHGFSSHEDPSDEQVLTWMSLAADDVLDAATRQRLEDELVARPHLLEASSWVDRIDHLASSGAQESKLPPLDSAALKASVLDRVRGESPRARAPERSRGFAWRWAPAFALLALAGVFSWQQLRQEPRGLGNVANESLEETVARGAAQHPLEELVPPPLDSRTDAQPEPESLPQSAFESHPESDKGADLLRQEVAPEASTGETLGGRIAVTDLEETEEHAAASRRDVDASLPAPARESRPQAKAVAPGGFARNSVAADAPSASPASLDDEAAESPTLAQLRLRLEEAEAGAELHAQLAEILAVVPSPREGKRELLTRELAGRARSGFEVESEAPSSLDSLITTLRAREAEVSDPELREILKAWLRRE